MAEMLGTIRIYDMSLLPHIKNRIQLISESTAKANDCRAEVSFVDDCPSVINHPEQTQHVIRLAKTHFGELNFSQDELPLSASEDFGLFLLEKPGCFFTLGTMKVGKQLMTLHTSNYDYNDDLIASGAYFFIKILEDRLNVTIID